MEWIKTALAQELDELAQPMSKHCSIYVDDREYNHESIQPLAAASAGKLTEFSHIVLGQNIMNIQVYLNLRTGWKTTQNLLNFDI